MFLEHYRGWFKIPLVLLIPRNSSYCLSLESPTKSGFHTGVSVPYLGLKHKTFLTHGPPVSDETTGSQILLSTLS